MRVALTFDAEHADRPNAVGIERLFKVLAAADARATFFLQGRWIETVPSVAQALVEGRHLIGSHGYYHGRMSHLTDEGIADDVRRAEEAIRQACGVDPRAMVPLPVRRWRIRSASAGAITAAGYRHVGWHVDSEDWAEGATAEWLEGRVREGITLAGDGAVVLLHGWPAVDADRCRAAARQRSRR
jgi:peptidoglycan/xylan/chitin deacetylase (PgdA/CDA1 family)